MERNPSQLRELRCRYATNNVPFLLIGPFKLEEVSRDPLIVVYHNAMYDNEIEYLKLAGRSILQRQRVFYDVMGTNVITEEFIAKSSPVDCRVYGSLTQIYPRIEDMTKMVTNTDELLELVNFGVGGYNYLHLDFNYVRPQSTIFFAFCFIINLLECFQNFYYFSLG